MNHLTIIPFEEGQARLDWLGLTDALAAGHKLPKATVNDTFLYRDQDTLLNRCAWIDGLGIAVKSATIFPGNSTHGLPPVNGGVSLYRDSDGTLEALIDFQLVTKWKTAGDSLLAALHLARADSERILIVGAGTVARSLFEAYSTLFPKASFEIWNRNHKRGLAMADALGIGFATDLETAVRQADIVTSATMTHTPILKGDWLRPGQHIDLIGAYRPDMREADDDALRRAKIFVDARETTIGHIGEIEIPLSEGIITKSDIIADYYTLDEFKRGEDDITLFKNGGGAHLDLMTSRYILEAWQSE